MGPLAKVGAWGTLLSVAALLLLGAHAGTRGAGEPARLREAAQQQAGEALAQAGFGWARLKIVDSVGVLQGEAPDEPARAALEAQARELLSSYMGLPGVFLGLDNRVRVRPRHRSADLLAELPPTGAGSTGPAGAAGLGSACAAAFEAAQGGESIPFRAASSQLEPASKALLRRLASVAARCPHWRLVVEGHADDRGEAGANERLARRRANAVAAELLLQGVPVEQLEALGVVDVLPPGRAADARLLAASRRVDLRFVQAEAH
ncbi:MAG: OmpA family protein [Burkholderiaceae bacterium]|nr:OmpA family protein [Burkholderiaceae bacterium]